MPEAIARCRKRGHHVGTWEEKWLTVPTMDLGEAARAFADAGYETAGLRVVSQEKATRLAERLFGGTENA